jgi:hypothetical protein
MARVAVIVPARDEAAAVAGTVAAALAIEGVTRVLVVDDGSRDGTAELARGAGAQVLTVARSAGKGAALEAGLAMLDAEGLREPERLDAVLFLDADLGATAGQAAALLAPVLADEADMSVAAFPPAPAGTGGFGLAKGLARRGVRALGSKSYAADAPLSGQRALGPAALSAVRPIASGYGVEVALTIRALRRGLRVVEVPTTMAHRPSGRNASGFAHRGRQFLDVALTLSRLAFEPREGPRA